SKFGRIGRPNSGSTLSKKSPPRRAIRSALPHPADARLVGVPADLPVLLVELAPVEATRLVVAEAWRRRVPQEDEVVRPVVHVAVGPEACHGTELIPQDLLEIGAAAASHELIVNLRRWALREDGVGAPA